MTCRWARNLDHTNRAIQPLSSDRAEATDGAPGVPTTGDADRPGSDLPAVNPANSFPDAKLSEECGVASAKPGGLLP